MGRLAHNKAVQKEQAQKAMIEFNGFGRTVDIATGHLDDVAASDGIEYAQEIDDEIHEKVDQIAVREKNADSIGYATVKDGEFVDYTIYGQFK